MFSEVIKTSRPSKAKFAIHSENTRKVLLWIIRGLLEKYPTFGREKETGLLGALDT